VDEVRGLEQGGAGITQICPVRRCVLLELFAPVLACERVMCGLRV